MEPVSNPRIRSYFQFDPLEFIDDVVIATSEYINGGLGSLAAIVDLQDLPEGEKEGFLTKLRKRLQRSLNTNSDLFEMYVMRNIFWVDIDVDLAFEISKTETTPNVDLDETAEDKSLDVELEELRSQIKEEIRERRILLSQIRETQTRMQIAEETVERIPEMQQLLNEMKVLPVSQIVNASSILKSIKERFPAESAKTTIQSLVFD